MEITVSFVAGLAVGLVLWFQGNANSQIAVTSYQQKAETCTQQLAITEGKLNGMLMNK